MDFWESRGHERAKSATFRTSICMYMRLKCWQLFMARWYHAVLFGDGLAEETAINKNMRDKNKINNVYPYHVPFRILTAYRILFLGKYFGP